MINNCKIWFLGWAYKSSEKNNAYITFQVTRSFLAISSLLTISFTPTYDLFTLKSFASTREVPFYNASFFQFFNFSNIWIGKALFIFVLILVLSGFFSKISSILHWYFSLSFSISSINVDGGDQITPVICLLLIPISFCEIRKNSWDRDIKNEIHYRYFLSNLFLRLLQLQIGVIYLSSGISKLNVPEWLDGTAYYYWFNDNTVGVPLYLKSLFGNLFSNSFAVATITWGTILFEILLFCCFFSKDKIFKKIIFILGVTFHLLISVIHGIFSFGLVMIGCLIIYLKSED